MASFRDEKGEGIGEGRRRGGRGIRREGWRK
jgi:hypothetical protein